MTTRSTILSGISVAMCAPACSLPPCPPNATMGLTVDLPDDAVGIDVPMTFEADDGLSFVMSSEEGTVEVRLPGRPSRISLPAPGTAVTVDYEADDSFYVLVRVGNELVFEGGRPGSFPPGRRMGFGRTLDGPRCLDAEFIRTPATLRFEMDGEEIELASSEEAHGTIDGAPFAAIALSADSLEPVEQKPDCCGTDANGFLVRLTQEGS